MDQNKMFELTQQVRLNQTELKDFLSDMDSWETDIKAKDDNLRKSDKQAKTPELPPVRNSVYKKKTKKKVKEKGDKNPQRISGRDFRAWDKYDVDKALEEVDDQEPSSESEYETDEEWEIERKKQQATMLKDEGNQFFKDGQYAEAISCYTKGIQCDQTNAILFANRAMALLKQERYAAAEVDCTDALTLDPTYVKAYSRRATARLKLEMHVESKADFEKVLRLEPSNKMAKSELEKIEKILNPPEPDPEGLVFPVFKSPEQRSKKRLRRIEIEEIGDDDNKVNVLKTVGRSEVTKTIIEQDNKMFESFIKTGSNQTPPDDVKSSESDKHHDETTHKSDVVTPVKPKSSAGKENLSPRTPTSPRNGAPQTSFQFQTDWKVLRNDLPSLALYLQEITPRLYPKLIGESLEADVLLTIVRALKEHYASFEDVFSHLKFLTNVKRFGMIVMFMSDSDKKVFKDVFTAVEAAGKVDKAELSKLRKSYEI